MNFGFDQRIHRLVMSRGTPAISSLSMNAGDTELLDLSFFYASSTRVLPGADWEIQISVKDAEGGILAVANQWTFHPETASYRASLDLNTQELRDAFGSDAFLTAYLQLIYSTDDGEDPVVSQVVSVSIRKQVASFDDLTPTSLPTPLAWLANALNTATAKTTPVDADTIPISDSAASGGLKKLTFSNLRAWVSSYFIRHDSTQPIDADGKARAIANIGAVPEALELEGPPEGDAIGFQITNGEDLTIPANPEYDPLFLLDFIPTETEDTWSTDGSDSEVEFPDGRLIIKPFSSSWVLILVGAIGPVDLSYSSASASPHLAVWNPMDGTVPEVVEVNLGGGTEGTPGQVVQDPEGVGIFLPDETVADLLVPDRSREADGVLLVTNSDGGKEIALWNETQGIYQILRLSGLPGLEKIDYSNLP